MPELASSSKRLSSIPGPAHSLGLSSALSAKAEALQNRLAEIQMAGAAQSLDDARPYNSPVPKMRRSPQNDWRHRCGNSFADSLNMKFLPCFNLLTDASKAPFETRLALFFRAKRCSSPLRESSYARDRKRIGNSRRSALRHWQYVGTPHTSFGETLVDEVEHDVRIAGVNRVSSRASCGHSREYD